MAPRRTKLARRLAALGVVVVILLCATLLAGVVAAAHRDVRYRRTVDQAFAATASALVVSSNATGAQLANVLAHPGSLGRLLLDVRLQSLVQATALDSQTARSLASPPPDANAFIRLANTLRLRAEATLAIERAVEGLLRITPVQPVGSAAASLKAPPALGVDAAAAHLGRAGELLVAADRTYHGLPETFKAASGGSTLPGSRWTFPSTGTLTPDVLAALAATMAADPRLQATIGLRLVAVATSPLELPVGGGYPINPTSRLVVWISVLNAGTAPSHVLAIIRVTPTGHSHGHLDSGMARGVAAAGGAVALRFPTMAVVPGEHCLVTIEVVRPRLQTSSTGLSWSRTVVVGRNPGR